MQRRLRCCGLRLAATCLAVAGLSMAVPAADTSRYSLWIVNRDGTNLKRLTAEPLPGHSNCGSAHWSSDGERIAFDATPGTDWKKSRIVVIHVAGAQAGLVRDLGPGVQPCWSPDGSRIAFYLNPGAVAGEPYGVWVMNADGGERQHLGTGTLSRWFPDGEYLLCTESFTTSRQLHELHAKIGTKVRDFGLPNSEFLWKPSFLDEETILCSLRVEGQPQLCRIRLGDNAEIVERLCPQGPECKLVVAAPDGQFAACVLTVIGQGNLLHTLSLTDPNARPVLLPMNQKGVQTKDAAWSPDSQKIVFASTARTGEITEYLEALQVEDLRLLQPQEPKNGSLPKADSQAPETPR